MIFFLPIEPLDARYTKQMLGWVGADLEGLVGADGYKVILPEYSGGIKHGQFLDSFASARFKTEQLQIVSSLFERGGVHSADLFLLGDVWFPGIESVRLMADLAGVHVKIVDLILLKRRPEHQTSLFCTSSACFSLLTWVQHRCLDPKN